MKENKPILFFDGHCNLCNSFIDLLVRVDKKHRVYIASLQGQAAKEKLPPEVIEKLSSVVLLDSHGHSHFKSSAIFRVAWAVGGPLLLLVPFWILPRFFTNWVYDFVALSRYKLFGRRNTCRLPTPQEKAHFLD